MQSKLNDLIAQYYAARQAYDNAKKISDDFDHARRTAERTLVDHMIENGINKVSLDDGTTPTLVSTAAVKVTKENSEEIRQWLLDTMGDDHDFLETVVSKSAVAELVRGMIADGNETNVPACLELNQRPTLRVTGWKGRE
jgi:hypothetical protein